MDNGIASGSSLILPIPDEGLSHVLSAWNGQGRLWEALASIESDDVVKRDWTARDIQQRAHRIVFEELEPFALKWPLTISQWLNYLPTESVRQRAITSLPHAGTSWSESRIRGWPPREFVGHSKSRGSSTVLVTALKWTIEQLQIIREHAVKIDATIDNRVRRQLDVAAELLEIDPLASAEGMIPSRAEIGALHAEGNPWHAVASVANTLRHLAGASLIELAHRLIMPFDDLRWRLFHLAILGKLLIALDDCGASITSLRPLASFTVGPAYALRDEQLREWHVWFEAAGAYRHYKKKSPYLDLVQDLPGTHRPLGVDLLLIRPGDRALLIECKYSSSEDYIGRSAYQQTVCYAAEVIKELAPTVTAVIVVPEGVLERSGTTTLPVGEITLMTSNEFPSVVRNILNS